MNSAIFVSIARLCAFCSFPSVFPNAESDFVVQDDVDRSGMESSMCKRYTDMYHERSMRNGIRL